MRTLPLVLSADMSLRQAIARADANGLWPDLDAPPSRACAEQLSQLSGISRHEAREELARRVQETWVVIRRLLDASVRWYLFDLPSVFSCLATALDQEDVALGDALKLDRAEEAVTAELRDLTRSQRAAFQGLLLDEGHPIGVQARRQPGTAFEISAPLVLRTTHSTPVEPPASAPAPAPAPTTAPRADAHADGRKLRAYPSIDAPAMVVQSEEFVISVGLSAAVTPGVTGTVVLELPATEESFLLGVLVVADEFQAPRGWRHSMTVRTQDPFAARVEIPLTAPALAAQSPLLLTSLVVLYTLNGAVCGHGTRRIVVCGKEEEVDGGATPGPASTEHPAPAGAIVLDGSVAPADLEIIISKPDDNVATGRYSVTFSSPHQIALPLEPLVLDLGVDAASFAKGIIDSVALHSGSPMLERVMRGQAKSIADVLPRGFWPPLQAAAQRVKLLNPEALPSVLLITAEPYVPWELAYMAECLDSSAPPFLGAQAKIGRWLMTPSGRPRPPKTRVDVSTMATMIGFYNPESGLRQLPMAEQEGETLRSRYGAVHLPATEPDLLRLLDARLDPLSIVPSGAEVIHVAAHGEVDPTAPGSAALFLSNRKALTPFVFRDAPIGESHEPFIFLNACMIGTSGELLGGAGGYPHACLLAGFRALVGPLWAVKDEVAHDIALEFYERAFGADGHDPEEVGAILTDFRRRATSESFDATFLSYVLYGHPGLTMHPGWRK